jgi:hypothetical protein
LIGKYQEMELFGKPRHLPEHYIKMDLREIGFLNSNCFELACNRIKF